MGLTLPQNTSHSSSDQTMHNTAPSGTSRSIPCNYSLPRDHTSPHPRSHIRRNQTPGSALSGSSGNGYPRTAPDHKAIIQATFRKGQILRSTPGGNASRWKQPAVLLPDRRQEKTILTYFIFNCHGL